MTRENLEFLRTVIDSEQQIEPATAETVKFKVRTGGDVPVKRRMKATGLKMRASDAQGVGRKA